LLAPAPGGGFRGGVMENHEKNIRFLQAQVSVLTEEMLDTQCLLQVIMNLQVHVLSVLEKTPFKSLEDECGALLRDLGRQAQLAHREKLEKALQRELFPDSP